MSIDGDWTWSGDLPLRSSADTDGEVSRVLGKLESSDQDLTVLRLVANAPDAFRPFVLLANALIHRGHLPAAVRELVILWLGVEEGSAYEWATHHEAARAAGLSQEQLMALRAGTVDDADAPFDDEQRLALRLCRRLHAGERWGDEEWAAAATAWGREGALDLAFTVGWWGGMVPHVLRAFGLEPR
ncbi:MAG: carboxymuconolactone decarboxylase family protein [Actinobacteria bacterium]|nr:carboxymuconolactone decarboxylase family protein [Actinomycetota bacterium]